MKTKIEPPAVDLIAALSNYLEQMKRINEFMDEIDINSKFDEVLREKLKNTKNGLFTAAEGISEIIGRETLELKYFGESIFNLENNDENN